MGGEATCANLERALAGSRVLPVQRVGSAAQAVVNATAEAVAPGLGVVELTATTNAWAQVLRTCWARWPQLAIGVGTVTSAEIARRTILAELRLLMVSGWEQVLPPAAAVGQPRRELRVRGYFALQCRPDNWWYCQSFRPHARGYMPYWPPPSARSGSSAM
jgi:hypothetical protein